MVRLVMDPIKEIVSRFEECLLTDGPDEIDLAIEIILEEMGDDRIRVYIEDIRDILKEME